MLRKTDNVSLHWSLRTISKQLRTRFSDVFPYSMFGSLSQSDSAFTFCVSQCPVVKGLVPEMIADQLPLQRLKGILYVIQVV